MKTILCACLCALVLTMPAAPQRPDNDPDRVVSAKGKFPAGWNVRPDRGTADQLMFTQTADVYHFTMGSAGTFYNSAWMKSGDYKFSARLTQKAAPSHPISYGLMIGGNNLAGDMQTYSYFLVRNQAHFRPVAPLFAAMASEVHHVAAQLGQASPGGRLDPPLLMALDEIVQTCPVPLPTWLADSGGKGIQLIPVAHGEAQLRTRWQQDGAQVVLDTCGVKVWLPGISDTATLRMASDLCGQTALRERGQRHHSRHDVMTPDMIRQLPAGHALIIRGSYSPVLARLGVAWKDRTYNTARRRGSAIAELTAAPAARPAPADTSGARPAWPRSLPLRPAHDRIPDPASVGTASDDHPWS